jgi:peptide deformylase
MAILHVAQMGHPVLRQIAEPVDPATIRTPEFQAFCDDLLETMEEYDGAGLAAPQVHHSIRVAVLTLSEERGPEFFINPVITFLTDEKIRFYEGCLSVEGIRAAVDRCAHIRVEALERDGSPKLLELQGFPAVVVQHECDHLDGVLYVDRADTRTMAFLKELRKWGPLDETEVEVDDDVEEEAEGPSGAAGHSPLAK